ncbi:MAG: EAL domain-containing protein [Paucibacter sp.]|nr:EAL domain-containing protein [Roseateles sp.]
MTTPITPAPTGERAGPSSRLAAAALRSLLSRAGLPARTTLAYVAFASLWILVSDDLLATLVPDKSTLARWSAAKGIAFVACTGVLLYGLLRRGEARARAQSSKAEAERSRIWRLLEGIADALPDALHIKDLDGRFVFVNREAARLFGGTPEQLKGKTSAQILPADQAHRITESDRAALAAGLPVRHESVATTVDGVRCYAVTKGALRDQTGAVVALFGLSQDITELRQNEHRQRQWAMAFENIGDAVVIVDTTGRIQAVNPAFTKITGHAADEVAGAHIRLLRSGVLGIGFYRQMWRVLRDEGHWRGEVWNRRKNGEVYPASLVASAVRDAQGAVTHYVGVLTDISHNKNTEAELERLAHYDALTQLPNRALLHESLANILPRASRNHRSTAVLVIDLDGFKTVNDSLGHPAGDELLVQTAARLRSCLRPCDLLGRLGGDEFLVVQEDCGTAAEVAAFAQELLAALAAPVRLSSGAEVYVTASIGISLHPDDGSEEGVVELLRNADAALYRGKEAGRNRFCFYTADMNASAVAKLDLEAALSQALDRGELLLHYQPKVDAGLGTIIGAEALLRWARTGTGLVPPGQFMPLIEQSSLILDIGAWVIDEACRQLRAWMDEGRPCVRLAVNVAARQFAAGDLDQVVASALLCHRVEAQWLELEITEGMLITDPQSATEMLMRLKALGVTLSLDDFGTGYSSLGYLQQLPIDELKIDQSFVRRLGQHGTDGEPLVDVVIALAHRLGLRVVAEGVETTAQRDYLWRRGCDEMQGFLFGRPVPAHALQERLGEAASSSPRHIDKHQQFKEASNA